MDNNEKNRENRARRAAKSQGLILKKSRAINTSINNQGGYMIIYAYNNVIKCGERFDLSLDEVEKFLSE